MRRVGGGPRGDRLAAVVGQHLEQLIGQQGGAGGAAAAAEQVERKENDVGLHEALLRQALLHEEAPSLQFSVGELFVPT